MPLSRYQIRNECSLADADLYRAADKDDPEALLEGLAMAGLVGILRQLGDLAEFAADIFHDLHEEVMATTSRGHSLLVRVQQLEAEFPTIEKAFLSQINHSAFFYNAGMDWHPNLRMDPNVITQGDLPRFIMDSYEECRGPPHLFLLDKFDVAGAGACLKRYTDPSVFKADMSYSGIASTDVLREKKTRKAKKKGSRWRNGETPETVPASHAKLHQLFLEERIENGTSYSAHCVKLRRRLNGFPFSSRYGKGYMEKLLKSPSPDHEEVHEIPVDPSPLAVPSTNTYDSYSEIVEIGISSPDKDSKQRMRCPSSSPTREVSILESVVDELNEGPCTKENSEASKSNSNLDANDISSTLQKIVSEKERLVDGGIKTEGSVDDYQSDDIASEIDNYVDALTIMESEMDRELELRSKNNLNLNSGRQASDVDGIGERVQAYSLDLFSIGNSTLSDENSSAKKDISRFSYSSSHSISAKNSPSDGEVSSNVFSSPEIHEAETSLIRKSIDEEEKLSQPPGGTVSDGVFTETVEIPSHSSELGDPSASSNPSDSAPVSENAGAGVKEIASVVPEPGEVVENLSRELPFIPSISDAWEQKGDLSLKFSGENQHSDEFEDKDTNEIEDLGCMSYLCVSPLCKDGLPLQVSLDNKLDAELQDDVNHDKIVTSTSDCHIVHDIMNENPFLLSSENQPPENLHDEGPNWSNNSSSTSNPSDPIWHNKDDLSPKMPKNLPVDDFTVKDHSFLPDATICASDIMEAATEKKFTENMLDNVPQIGNPEAVLVQNSVENQICPHNLVVPRTEDLSINPTNAESETHYSTVELVERVSEVSDAIPSAGERSENVIFKEDTPIICKSVDSVVSGTTADIPALGASKERTLYLRERFSDDPSNVKHGAVVDEAAYDPDSLETDTTSEPSLMAGVHVHLDEVDHEPVNAPAGFADHEDHTVLDDDDNSPVDLKKFQGGSLSNVKDGRIGLDSGTCFLDSPGESEITDDKCNQKFASPDLSSLCKTVIDDYSRPQVFDDASNEYVISGSGSKLNLGNAPTCQSSVQHSEEELKQIEENVDLQPKELDDKLLIGGEANSQLSNQLQTIHNSNHDDQIGPFDASSESLLVNIDSQSSVSELLPQGNSKIDTGQLLDPSRSLSSGFSLLTETSQIYVEEMPPLPPLPPVQWRMGKLQHTNPTPDRFSAKHNAAAFPSLLPSSANQDAQPLNPFLPQSALAYDKSTPVSEQPMYDNSPFLPQLPPMVHDAAPKDNILPLEGIQSTRTLLQLPLSHGEMLQSNFHAGNGEKVTSLDSFSNAPAVDTAPAENLSLSQEEVKRPLDCMTRETSLKEMELGQCPAHSEKNVVTCDTTDQALKVAVCAIPTSEENLLQPTAEDGKLHGIQTMKLPRPWSPLIDAVAIHDKSKLRRVTERVRPQIQKEEEKDSLLEQIRTKSFNLKPAVVTRPSIQGPKTNLKVAAILEKAKSIRQALAGSDGDDDGDDSWSDS